MNPENEKIGITLDDWDAVRTDPQKFTALQSAIGARAAIILSTKNTEALPMAMRDFSPRSYVADCRTLSRARLARLCDDVFHFDGTQLTALHLTLPAAQDIARLGFIVSNGFGLGHVTRMQALAKGLASYAVPQFMSFSAGLTRDAFYLPSQQYLQLDTPDGLAYTREATSRFFNHANPSHVFYDGNNIPAGVLAALASRPHIHLTWIRRGMWQPGTEGKFMAVQAMADLVIEPGDLADEYDTGPSWQGRNDYCPPRDFLKTPPIRPLSGDPLPREEAMRELTMDPRRKHVLLMLGASQKTEDKTVLLQTIEQVRKAGFVPVIAHWPISHDEPPRLQWALTIERMPIARFYNAFDVIVSAAGYNSFHELVAGGHAIVFMPQEDEGRDQQLARARYAVDKGLAQLCRRTDLENLHAILPLAQKTQGKAVWMDDFDIIAKTIGLGQKHTGPLKRRHIAPNAKTLKKEYKGWKRGQRHLHKNTFVLALDMKIGTFLKKARTLPRETTIVLTDSVDPIALRRAGFKYVWINNHMLSAYGLSRQFLSWLKIWKPKKIRDLNSRFG